MHLSRCCIDFRIESIFVYKQPASPYLQSLISPVHLFPFAIQTASFSSLYFQSHFFSFLFFVLFSFFFSFSLKRISLTKNPRLSLIFTKEGKYISFVKILHSQQKCSLQPFSFLSCRHPSPSLRLNKPRLLVIANRPIPPAPSLPSASTPPTQRSTR